MKTVYTNTKPATEDVLTVTVSNSAGQQTQGSTVVAFQNPAKTAPSPAPSAPQTPDPSPLPSPTPRPLPKSSPQPSPSPVDQPPVVSVSADASSCHPLPGSACQVTVTATASDPDGDPLTYSWSGCATGSSPKTSCSVTSLQTFTATVTVTDGRGGSATASANVSGVNASPSVTVANWGISCPTSPPQSDIRVDFTITDKDGDMPKCTFSCNVYCTITSVDYCGKGGARAEVATTQSSGLMALSLVASDPWGASSHAVAECGY